MMLTILKFHEFSASVVFKFCWRSELQEFIVAWLKVVFCVTDSDYKNIFSKNQQWQYEKDKDNSAF